MFRKILLSSIGSLMLCTAAAQALVTIPADTAVRYGTLDNGLTYYVRHNNYPEQRADFFIAQRVGSIQEQENQRGLAHFLEHMCFNGTRHFPGNSLISYMESIGVKFGANLNAYTSTDETVYNISNVPTMRSTVIDTCLLVLSDWSHDLLLREADIDAERGVIEGEWRMRSGANYRLLDKVSPMVYPNCLYGQRMPIGLMDVVRNFKPGELRDYYKKWYHPGNQCIIVVGDVDADRVVQQIRQLFGKVRQPKKISPVTPVTVPDNETIIAAVATDREQTTTSVRLMFKHADLPDSFRHTSEFLRRQYLTSVVTHILNERFADFVQQPDAPFTQVRAADRNFMISKTCQAFQLFAVSKPGQAAASMEWMAREVKRAVQHGFTDSEFRRARLNYESALDKLYRERDRYPNTRLARDFVRAYLDGEPIPSIDTYTTMMRREIDGVSVDEARSFLDGLVSTSDHNTVLLVFAPDNEQQSLPSEQALIDAFHNGRNELVSAYVDTISNRRLLPELPDGGSIVAQTEVPQYQANLYTLSNGIRLWAKQTAIKPDEVVIAGAAPGGLSRNYTAENAPSYKALNAVIAASGFGQFSANELKKVLAGNDVKMRTFVNKTEQGFQGTAARADLETAFQLLYLKLTSAQKDQAAFDAFLEAQRSRLANQGNDPKFEFADSIFANVWNRHPLGAEKLALDEINRVNYDTILNCYRDCFADFSGLNVYVVGDFDPDSLQLLAARYLGSLPAVNAPQQPADIGYRLFSGNVDRRWDAPMENPQDKVYFFWTSECPYSLRNSLLAKITGQLLSNIFREEIREKRGWTYHVDTHCSVVPDLNAQDPPVIFLPLNVTVTAGKAEDTRNIIINVVNNMAQQGPSDEQLDKVKQYLRKVNAEDLQDNTYWMVMMKNNAKYGMDFHTDYLSTLDSITAEDIRQFTDKYINGKNRLSLTMLPRP